MEITTEQVKKLREETGVSIMQCKKALREAQGDTRRAMVVLRKEAGVAALKKGERDLKAGVVEAYIHNTKEVGAMVVLSCETDFVAKNEQFKQLAHDIALHIAGMKPLYVSAEEIPDEIKENEYNLNIPRYVDTFEEEEPIDIDFVSKELKKLHTDEVGLQKKITRFCKELKIDKPF